MSGETGASAGGGASRKRGPYANGIMRRKQILDTAVTVFGEQGYAGGSLRDIANRVGVTAPAIIRLFGSKEGLLAATLAHSEESSSFHGEHGLARLERWARVPRANLDNRGLVGLLLMVAAEASRPEHPAHDFMVDRYRRVVDALAEDLRIAADHGDIHPISDEQIELEAHGFVALMDGLELQWMLDPTVDLVGIHDHHFNLMMSRLGAAHVVDSNHSTL